jgi:single-strand DNA-binding protein
MNLFIAKGRLTKDPEVRAAKTSDANYTTFSIAVNRNFKKEGQPDADFFNCIAFGKIGEFIANYFTKGKEILINGTVQNRKWTDDSGQTHYATDIIVNAAEFTGSKPEGESAGNPAAPNSAPSRPPEGDYAASDEDDLPF